MTAITRTDTHHDARDASDFSGTEKLKFDIKTGQIV